ncbi:MAG: BrnT family toxin [Hyphomicrobiales bacterium]|jgi:uncharacterized DUF497 family protein|nr:BrnT family toxin [Hyphomicrobiales bacterium]
MSDFEWDVTKDRINHAKHGGAFQRAQHAFLDPRRVIAEDLDHSAGEPRYFCFGRVDDAVMTVRFTYRAGKIRIFGAGYWRKGKAIYEKANRKKDGS